MFYYISDKAGVVDDNILDTVCTVTTGLVCQKQGTACTAVDTTCKAIKDPVGTALSALSGLFG